MNEILKIIFKNLCEQEINRLITVEKTEAISKDSIEYEEFRNDIKERLKVKLKTGVGSEFLIHQFVLHQSKKGEKYGDKIEFYNVSEILNLIENIEDNKMAGIQFTGQFLKDYFHIHHNACAGFGSSLVRNVKEYWFKRNGIIHSHKVKEFEEILNNHCNSQLSTIARVMHDKAVFNRNLRGEWLIYRVVGSKKYYLCLAAHREGIDRVESDKNIYLNKISKCLLEFPELRKTHNNK